MNCPHCQQENPQNANFCRNCGQLLAANCPRCQTLIIPTSHYCHQCGLPLSPQSQAAWWPTAVSDRSENISWPESSIPDRSPTVPALQSLVPTPSAQPAPTSPAPTPALDRFLPRELADKLEAARISGSMVGERRVLTMLFCDVKGSTAAAEQLDPEEWTDIINGAFEHMIKPVYKYEGTVARLMGDAILAFFGAPIAHEDDPQRAVLSGLEIVDGIKTYQKQIIERYGLDITARVGINTGLVVVGAVGSNLRMEYTAMGDAINLAARMEQTAEPGTVQIADPTYQLVNPLFDLEELGPVKIKGKSEPVPVYRVLGRKAVWQNLRGIEGMRSALIGRDRELNTLNDILDRTRQGLGHIICLTGDAGLGKSRLIEEAHNYWQNAGFSGNWQAVSSFSYETNHAYGLFQRLIRRLNNIGVADSPAILRQKLKPLTTIFPEERQPRIMQIFETIFGLESERNLPRLEGESFRQELFNIMLQIWNRRFANQPTVLIFDDVHWSDPASVQLLEHLFSATDSIPLVLICAFRPDRDAPSATLLTVGSQQFSHRYTEIRITTLPDEDINAILDKLLAIADLPDKLRQNILDRAGGNPFFIEEVVRSLVLSGIVVAEEKLVEGEVQQVWRAVDGALSTKIPDNLQGLLAARIDRLEESIRATLQLASVIGRSFYERVLTGMAANSNGAKAHTTQHLRHLLQLQIIQEAARIPEVEYIFRNPLTQEVAYNGILLKRRREFHNQVGLAMEILFSEQLIEMSPRLAFHFQEGRQPVKAFHYYVMAGDQARLFYAHQEALAHYDLALSLIDDVQPGSDQLIQLYLDRGRVLEHGGKFVDALAGYETLGNLGNMQGNKEMRLQALIASGTIHAMQTPLHNPEIGQQLAADGLVLAQELDNKAGEAKIQWNLMQMARIRGQEGDAKLAISYGERSLKLARDLNLRSQMALTLNDLAALYRYDGQIDRAKETAREARVSLREIGNMPMLADSFGQSAHFLSLSGEFDEAEEAAVEAKRISSEIGNLWNQGISAFTMGLIELERGHLGAVLSLYSNTLNLAGIERLHFIANNLNMRFAELFIAAGALDKARMYIEKILLAVQDVPAMAPPARSLLAHIQLLKEPDQAQKMELDIAPTVRTDSLLKAYYSMFEQHYQIELALAQEKTTFAIQRARETIAGTERFDIKIFLPVFRLLLARGLWLEGDEVAAQKTLAEAETQARAIGSRRSLWPILVQQAAWETDDEAARQLRAEARTVVNYIAENAGDELKQSFLNRPDVKELMSPA